MHKKKNYQMCDQYVSEIGNLKVHFTEKKQQNKTVF